MSEFDVTRIIEEIKVQIEILKHQYDYFKNMTTLNTGAFILIVAFMERAFEEPSHRYFILLSLVFFSLSLIFSLFVMKNYTNLMDKLWEWNFSVLTGVARVNKDVKILLGKLKKQRLWCGIFFYAGIVWLLFFAGANILLETNKMYY